MLTIQLDTTQIAEALNVLGAQEFPFAVSKALNDLGIRAADAERAVARANFTIRNEGVLKYGIVRSKQATKRDLSVDVNVSQRMAGPREAFGYLKKFEQGGVKGPLPGVMGNPGADKDTTVAVPTSEVRKTRKGVIVRTSRIASLNLRPEPGTKRIIGDRRAFIIKSRTGRSAGVIVQRVRLTRKRKMGPHQVGHDPGLRVLYVLERTVPIRPILHFQQTMERVAREQWPDAWQQAIEYSLRTMRADKRPRR